MKSILTTGALAALTIVTAVSLPVPAAYAATIVVNNAGDTINPDNCTLRAAMLSAKNQDGMNVGGCTGTTDSSNTINFSGSFTIAVQGDTFADVGNEVTVNDTEQSIIIDGDDASNRAFNVDPDGHLTLLDLTVQNFSSGGGGAVENAGSLTAENVMFKDNSAGSGGAINSGGTLLLTAVIFDGNESTSASGEGGAISFSGAAASMTLTGVVFMDNMAANKGGAIAVTSLGDPMLGRFVMITGAVFEGNSANGNDMQDGGGAIWAHNDDDDAHFSILQTVFLDNSADNGGGGAILLTLSSRMAYFDPMFPELGGIFASHFQGNSAGGSGNDGIGGAIFTRGELTVVSSSFINNSSSNSSGGAIGHNGGSSNGVLTVANVTFSDSDLFPGNVADENGGAIAQINSSGQAEVINSTFSGNSATNGDGGAIFNNNAGAFQVTNSILANNTAGGNGGNCGGEVIADEEGNIQFNPDADPECGTIPTGDPMLDEDGALPNPGPNVPPVFTISLQPDSAALGAGDQSICDVGPILNLDARGSTRPDGDDNCDSGAYESNFLGDPTEPILSFNPPSLDFEDVEVGTTSPPKIASLVNTGDANATGVVFSGLPDSGFVVVFTNCDPILPQGASCQVHVTFAPPDEGPFTATLSVDSDEGATAALSLEGSGFVDDPGAPVLSFNPPSLDFGDVDVGTPSPPQIAMLQNTGGAAATGVVFSGLPDSGFEADTSACGGTLDPGASCMVSVTFTPSATGPANATLTVDSAEGPTANLDLSGEGVPGPGGVPTPEALDVDGTSIASDGNGVFEPGEQVEVAPAWRNNDTVALSVMGTASGFTGPAGASYGLVNDAADYGALDPGAVASCLDTGLCYALEVDDPAVRPAPHWDATVDETLDDADATTKTWTLHIGESFGDVPRAHLFYPFVEAMLHHGMAIDCGGGNFCPDLPETRDMMAMAVLTALEGGGYQPQDCVDGAEVFADVPFDDPFCPWIEELFDRGVIVGCGGGNYCPGSPVTRAQMAAFLLKTLEGASYTPPACTGLFDDVACPSPFADWIEDLFDRGITAGCGTSPLRYCPGDSITRGQCAVFQSKNFDLPLYGP